MPQLGLTMEKGTILNWIRQEGETVRKGDPIVLIQTEKVEYEVEAPAPGALRKIMAPPGAELPVGAPMAVIADPSEDISALLAPSPRPVFTAAAPSERAPTAPGIPPAPEPLVPVAAPGATGAVGRVKISPVARRMAEERGIPIETLAGTGPEGRIVREDVERAIALRGQGRGVRDQEEEELIPLKGMRKAIFDRMGASWQRAARVTLFADVDFTAVMRLRRERGATGEQAAEGKVTINDLILLAVARALVEEPRINCRLEGDGIRILRRVNLAFAVDLGEGLVAPVIRDAGKLSLAEIAREARALTEGARAAKLLPDDLAGGTFTVTNMGAVGVEAFTPIINPPQAGILGVGRIMERPAVVDGSIVARSLATFCLVFDHRLIDGAPAARFLAKVKELLENPGWVG